MKFKKLPYTETQLNTVHALRLQNKDIHQIAQHMGIPEFMVQKITIKLLADDKLKYESNQFKQLDFNEMKIHKPKLKLPKIPPIIVPISITIIGVGIIISIMYYQGIFEVFLK